MKEEMSLERLFNSMKEKSIRKTVSKANFNRPAYSYTSICPDEKYRIVKAATPKLSIK